MQNVFLINASLVDGNITEAIRGLISNAVVVYTNSIDEFINKAKYYSIQPNVDTIYAVGGDGTVNLLANILINTNKKLGIIPIGKNNTIYKSIKKDNKIDVGYINNKLFLNHAIVSDTTFNMDVFDSNEKYAFKNFKSFEFATNIYGKYKITSANIIVISNGLLNKTKNCISDNKIETYFIGNKSSRLFHKNIEEPILTPEKFSVDLLGVYQILIDGDLYYISKFDFNLSKKQLEIETKELVQEKILVKN